LQWLPGWFAKAFPVKGNIFFHRAMELGDFQIDPNGVYLSVVRNTIKLQFGLYHEKFKN
jgi:hypothetical protein